MGEAKRRKMAGTFPDPIAAARRFWSERNPGAAADFRVPEGLIGLTMDVEGAPPTTCMVDASKIVEILEMLNETVRASGVTYESLVHTIAAQFLDARRQNKELDGIALGALWTAFNHPTSGDLMRRAISRALVKTNKAHITWRYSPHDGLAMALADSFVDLETPAALASEDGAIVLMDEDDGEHKPN